MQLIEIPVLIRSEVSGTVYTEEHARQKNRFGLKVCFYRQRSGEFIDCTTLGQDGKFIYNKLAPGDYNAVVDTAQLAVLKLKAVPSTMPFTIRIDQDGDIAGHIDFTLLSSGDERDPQK